MLFRSVGSSSALKAALEPGGDEIDADGVLDDQVYHYDPDEVLRYVPSMMLLLSCTHGYLFNKDLISIIDLEVIETRTNVPSATEETRAKFYDSLRESDVCCV